MSGPISPFYSPGGGFGITGSRSSGWTFTKAAETGVAETIATFKVSDDATGKVEILNSSSSDGQFVPLLRGSAPSTAIGFTLRAVGAVGGDSGSNAVMTFDTRIGTSTAVSTRPLYWWLNAGAAVLTMLPLNSGANSCLSWGTQTGAAPAFTTRSAGNRAVWYSNIGASDVDFATGVLGATTLWHSVARATSTFDHRWYGGTTILGLLRGDGVFNLGTNTTLYSRLGQKLETNTSANYGGAALNVWSTTAGEGSLLDFNRSRSATIGTHSAVASGDRLGEIGFRGSDGSAFIQGAGIAAIVDGTPGTNDMPTRLMFYTTPDGSASTTERMRITNAGDVGIGKTPTTGITLDLNGPLGLKSYTVATMPAAGTAAGQMIYVSDAAVAACVAFSNGTNWKRCDNAATTVV